MARIKRLCDLSLCQEFQCFAPLATARQPPPRPAQSKTPLMIPRCRTGRDFQSMLRSPPPETRTGACFSFRRRGVLQAFKNSDEDPVLLCFCREFNLYLDPDRIALARQIHALWNDPSAIAKVYRQLELLARRYPAERREVSGPRPSFSAQDFSFSRSPFLEQYGNRPPAPRIPQLPESVLLCGAVFKNYEKPTGCFGPFY